MKIKAALLFLLFFIPFNLQSGQPVDTSDICGFQYALSDTLMIYGFNAYELFLRSNYREESVSHKWNLSNGLESGEMDPTFVIPAADSLIEVCHKIIDGSGVICEVCEVIFHYPIVISVCSADFDFRKDSAVNSHLAYEFFDLSQGNISSWKWSFGDGDTSDLQNPYHIFSDPGFYHVILEIRTADSCNSTMVKHLFIRNSDECDLKIEYDVLESFPPQYQFYSNLYDPRLPYSHIPPSDDSTWFGIIHYLWNFGDGSYSADEFPRHVYTHSGNYTVNLEITYADGFQCSAALQDYFKGSDQPGECNLTGTVRDYTGLDGCHYLIELDNGIRLEPILNDTMFHFRDNQRVRLSYIECPDLMSICMAGIIAEITCIEEIDPAPQPPWPNCEQIILNTSFSMNGNYCSGTAIIEIITPCSAWIWYEMIMTTDYQILWSTGETTKTITGLCPGNLYFVNVTNPKTGQTYTAAFSIFQLNNVFPSWTFTRNENTFWFSLPVDDSYTVTWKFDNDVSLLGEDVSYTFNYSGNHQVLLVVKDQAGSEVYTETIQLTIPTSVVERHTESVTAFPNPANDVLFIDMKESSEPFTLNIYNFSGQILIEKHFPHISPEEIISLDISLLNQGIYLLIILYEDGSSQSIKVEKH
jgi:PKD repeat protein